ncbi:caspase family protein [Pseudoflavitalea rhizosphaerae]|uniref:caspase family protein n=1 Tax=Pseudoflavitalea rhizosphaerae TaxID=1884793 RepID=UPI000F8C5D64|nr:caspase family protein [Pseudoflavitalea rhizosphaerae]
MYIPIRKAILIHSQTTSGSYLEGVEKDIAEIRRFLISPNGGSFLDHEITILKNPAATKVLQVVRESTADYLFVYFSGHGYTSTIGQRMICLSEGNLCDLDLLNNSQRQLVMIDACRTLERGATIGGIKWPEEKCDYATGYSEARAWFNQCILQSPAGKIIVHATAHNKPAYEAPSGSGGKFTIALLDTVQLLQNKTSQTAILPVHKLFPYVGSVLKNRNVDQQPEVFYYDGFQTVPFALISPEFIQRTENTNLPIHITSVENHNANGLLLVLASLFVIAAISK